MYTHIYTWAPQATRMFTYKKYIGPQARATSWYKKSAHQPNQKRYTQYRIHQGASNAPPAAPPSGGGGGPSPPAPAGGGGAPAGPSCPGGRRPLVIAAAQLLAALGPAMVPVTLYTAPGIPHPGCGSTCPQARPAALPQNGGVSPLSLLRLPPVEHVMAPHQGHQSGASAPVSQPCWSPSSLIPWMPLSTWRSPLSLHRRSIQLHLAPARCQICTCTKQQTNNDISVYTSNICTSISTA
jgi:hypothetical protein